MARWLAGAGWAGWGWADASPGTVRVTRTTHGTVARGAFPPAQTTSAPPAAGTTYFLLIYRVHAEFIVFYIEHVLAFIQYLTQVVAKRLW